AKGISGYAEVLVNPDTVVLINPFYTTVPAGGTKQFSAIAYDAKTMTDLGVITFDWQIPVFGDLDGDGVSDMPGFDMFNIGTVSNTGLVTVKQDAMMGFPAVLLASVGNSITASGAAIITVSIASTCDCPTGDATIVSITINNPAPITLTGFGATDQINTTALDGSGNTVTGGLVYCSSDLQVVDVDPISGMITSTTLFGGTATITVCAPNATVSITVNVN
ncbi:MAG: hypothetical protein IIA88_10960, partial [Bacteroidetes bacterium]|nr:hypothetical protein [Bacteroidota bacterium]